MGLRNLGERLCLVPVVRGQEPEEGHEGGAPGGVLEVVAGPVRGPEHRREP